jgi:hypothetical protein
MQFRFLHFLTLVGLISEALAIIDCVGIELDINPKFKGLESYSSVLALESQVTTRSVTDGELVYLAKKGYTEMVERYQTKHGSEAGIDPLPGAMIVLAPQDSTMIYFGSSIKMHKGTDVYTKGKLKEYLDDCIHRYNGGCGEFNVLQAFFDSNPEGSPAGARVVAWVRRDKEPNVKIASLSPPCLPKGGKTGCQELVAKFCLVAIDNANPDVPGWSGTGYSLRNLVQEEIELSD